MKKNIIFIAVIVVVAVGGVAAFIWAYSQMTHYRDNSAIIAAQAAEVAKNEQRVVDEEAFNEKMKQPYAEFVSPSDFGSISFNYPRTWSAYNIQNNQSGYEVVFYPGVIPLIDNKTSVALRVKVINKNYEDELNSYERSVGSGSLTASPITVSDGQQGVIFNGNLNDGFKSSFVLLKLRDKTLMIQTDTDEFANDFNEVILATLKFIP